MVGPDDTVHILVQAQIHNKDKNQEIANLRGKTAYNSFAYQYTVNGQVGSDGATTGGTTLVAATERVGVRIPDYPKLVKKLENYEHGETKADQDYTFQFLVFQYDGNKLANGLDLDGSLDLEKLTTALTQRELKWFVQEVSVPANKSKSEAVSLYHFKEDGWIWSEGDSYAIVEIPDNVYAMSGWTSVASTGSGTAVSTLKCAWTQDETPMEAELPMLTFTYRSAVTETFTATNIDHRWKATFTKVDANTKRTLSGAVFARYKVEGDSRPIGEMEYGSVRTDYAQVPDSIETTDRIRWTLVDIVARLEEYAGRKLSASGNRRSRGLHNAR